jgi:four helix bundle protein
MKQNVIKDKSEVFAVRIINLCRYLKRKRTESTLTNQLLRSGTSIGANVQEATMAISRKEFAAKISISLKEARETSYWLRNLYNTNSITKTEYDSIATDSDELERILYAILKTVRMNEKG